MAPTVPKPHPSYIKQKREKNGFTGDADEPKSRLLLWNTAWNPRPQAPPPTSTNPPPPDPDGKEPPPSTNPPPSKPTFVLWNTAWGRRS
eukprot:scaffold213319_cov41-Tisochrysis_lutea.AAC.1